MAKKQWWKKAFGTGIYPLGALADTKRWKQETAVQIDFLKQIFGRSPGFKIWT